MIKIDKIIVNNFKNIEHAELSLGHFNVLVGQNNSGKTNFMQVISFLNFLVNGANDEVNWAFKHGFWSGLGQFLPTLKTFEKLPAQIILNFSDTLTNTIFNYEIEIERKEYEITNLPPESEMFSYFISRESFSFKNKTKTGKAISIFSRENEKIVFSEEIKKNTAAGDFLIFRVDVSVATGLCCTDLLQFVASPWTLARLRNTFSAGMGRNVAMGPAAQGTSVRGRRPW